MDLPEPLFFVITIVWGAVCGLVGGRFPDERTAVARAMGIGALLGLAGLLSLVDFSQAFVTFHELAFSNDLWILDPRTDYLIMLYPEGFWLDATLRIAMLSAIEAVVVGGVGLGIAYFGVRR